MDTYLLTAGERFANVCREKKTVQRPHDISQVDLSRRSSQLKSAIHTANTFNEAGAAQYMEEFIRVRRRDTLAFANFRRSQCLVLPRLNQLENAPNAIFFLGRNVDKRPPSGKFVTRTMPPY